MIGVGENPLNGSGRGLIKVQDIVYSRRKSTSSPFFGRYVCSEYIWILRNNFAISSDGVTEALQRGGSVLANYGVDLKDSIAMITGANELNMALLYSNI